MILLSIFVGLVSGLAAVLLKNLAGWVEHRVGQWFSEGNINIWYLVLPLMGILLTVLAVKMLLKDDAGHGVSKVLSGMSVFRGFISSKKAFSSIFGSALTVGFGGSVGLEAPVVLTGASLGSKLGRIFKLDYSSLMLLVGCGATAAVAGVFKAPITGIIFTLEVLLLDLSMASIVMLLLSSVTAALMSSILLGKSLVFSFNLNFDYAIQNIPIYILLGVIAGFVSVYFVKLNFFIEKKFNRQNNIWLKVILGSIVLGLLIFFFPPLFGEGFSSLMQIISGDALEITKNSLFFTYRHIPIVFLGFILLLVFLKVIATSLTTASGGIGGVFAPSLFVGGFLGFLTAHSLNIFFGLELPTINFALAGMAAVMSGVMHAPLTAIFLIAEITGGYKLFVPLIITATIAYLLNRIFLPHSIYAAHLAAKKELITHNKDKSVLSMMKLNSLIENNFVCLKKDGNLKDIVAAVSSSHRNIFPVVDLENNFVGVVLLDTVREIMFKPELYETVSVSDLLTLPSDDQQINITASMETAVEKFKIKDHYTLVVLDGTKYVGFLSRANVLSEYRDKVSELSND
ncbi:MAG: chloride channel protein [Bacteroidales bacterium]|nr:chloride channel protein [Bacteroidales bacterium]